MSNARFWTWIQDGPVKLTLRPGQELAHSMGGPCEEGYHYELTYWRFDGQRVTCGSESSSRDCDGPHEYHSVAEAPLDQLSAYEPWSQDNDDPALKGIRFPDWKQTDASQRDRFAEAMGY